MSNYEIRYFKVEYKACPGSLLVTQEITDCIEGTTEYYFFGHLDPLNAELFDAYYIKLAEIL